MEDTTTQILDKTTLVKTALKSAMSYTDYLELVDNHVTNGTSTGPEINESLANYTLLNQRRMRRWSKTFKFDEVTLSKLKERTSPVEWLVITESWCGDAAHATPVMQKFVDQNPNINLQIILRDENLDLMDAFLTNGARSIPKLIAFDPTIQEVLGDWGPRPSKATELVEDYKAQQGALTPEFKQELQVWYNKDKGQDIATDLLTLL